MAARDTHVKVAGTYVEVVQPSIKESGAYRSDCYRLRKKISGVYQIIWENDTDFSTIVYHGDTWRNTAQNAIWSGIGVGVKLSGMTYEVWDRANSAVRFSGTCNEGPSESIPAAAISSIASFTDPGTVVWYFDTGDALLSILPSWPTSGTDWPNPLWDMRFKYKGVTIATYRQDGTNGSWL